MRRTKHLKNHTTSSYLLKILYHQTKKASEYDQEIPQSQTADQPMAA